MCPSHLPSLLVVDTDCPLLAIEVVPLIAEELDSLADGVGLSLWGEASVAGGVWNTAVICGCCRAELQTSCHQYCHHYQTQGRHLLGREEVLTWRSGEGSKEDEVLCQLVSQKQFQSSLYSQPPPPPPPQHPSFPLR